MTWRVRVEPDVMRGGDVLVIGRPLDDGMSEVVVWSQVSDDGPVTGRVERIPATTVGPETMRLHVPDGVLDAIVAERRTPGPTQDLVDELRATLEVERRRVDDALHMSPIVVGLLPRRRLSDVAAVMQPTSVGHDLWARTIALPDGQELHLTDDEHAYLLALAKARGILAPSATDLPVGCTFLGHPVAGCTGTIELIVPQP